MPNLSEEIATGMQIRFGIEVDDQADLFLLLDGPLGWAFYEFEYVKCLYRNILIISDNPCPEYQLDLLSLRPFGLLSNVSLHDIVKTLEGFPTGPPYPDPLSPLSPRERETLKLVATDHSNDAIARLRNIETQTVKNTLHGIYQKLNLKSRIQVTHYYFGHWFNLRSWSPPPNLSEVSQQYLSKGTKVL
jgi:DNA-binding CsgD family transcriptional regulator